MKSNKLVAIENKNKAITIIELLVTLILIGIVAAISTPAITNIVKDNQLAGLSTNLVSSISKARNEAITKKSSVSISPIDSEWSNGWNVFQDLNNNGSLDSDETILESQPVSFPIKTSTASSLTFVSSGRLSSLNPWGDNLTICDSRNKGREYSINGAGSVTTTYIQGDCKI